MAAWQFLVVLYSLSESMQPIVVESMADPIISTQKILQHARMAEMGSYKADAVAESISLELDMINIL